MKLDLNFIVKDLDGNDIPDANAGQIIAAKLVGSSKGDALKFYDWGRTLNKKEPITVDRSDLRKIREFVEFSDQIPIITKVPVLNAIDQCKEEA